MLFMVHALVQIQHECDVLKIQHNQPVIICAAMRVNRSSGFPTRSDKNWPVQSQKQARNLKFRIKEEEGLYYPCSENKGADQLRSYCKADLRLCFRIGKNPVFNDVAHFSGVKKSRETSEHCLLFL